MTTESEPAVVCEACGHDTSAHDTTAQRYCKVSLERSAERRCICRGQEPAAKAVAAPGRTGAPMYGRGRFSGK
jgi:hypothetical protein